MAKNKDVLSISTVTKRRSIIIDGKKLQILNQSELKLDAAVRVRGVLAGFLDKSKLTESSALSLSQALTQSVRDIIIAMPAELDEKLSDENRIDICIAFFRAPESPAPSTAPRQPAKS